jgi:hypothetical protein
MNIGGETCVASAVTIVQVAARMEWALRLLTRFVFNAHITFRDKSDSAVAQTPSAHRVCSALDIHTALLNTLGATEDVRSRAVAPTIVRIALGTVNTGDGSAQVVHAFAANDPVSNLAVAPPIATYRVVLAGYTVAFCIDHTGSVFSKPPFVTMALSINARTFRKLLTDGVRTRVPNGFILEMVPCQVV